MTITTDTAKLPLLLGTLKLPTISRIWPEFCAMANKEGWSAERLLTALCELELSEREQRRVQRHLAAARLPQGQNPRQLRFLGRPDPQQSPGQRSGRGGHLVAIRP